MILLLKDRDLPILDLIIFGNNCNKWLSYIFSHKDISVTMSGVDLNFKDLDIRGICLNDDSKINNNEDWVDKMLRYV